MAQLDIFPSVWLDLALEANQLLRGQAHTEIPAWKKKSANLITLLLQLFQY
jgi:hypothetical protein